MGEIIKHKNPSVNRFARESLPFTSDEFLVNQDPTILGFKLMFQWNNNYGLLSQGKSIPGSGPQVGVNTALAYLQRIGDNTRAAYMQAFLDLLRNINNKTPWYFQTIEGLTDLWKHDLTEYYKEDRQISIGCLESLDLRMTALMDLYRKACFDWKHRREVVPSNLRRFDLWIYVYDWRMFNDFENENDAAGTSKRNEQTKLFGIDKFNFDKDDDLNIGRTTNRILFKLRNCEFLSNESAHLEGVSNPEANTVAQKITIKYLDYEEENVYNMFLDGKVSDDLLNVLDKVALDIPVNIFASPISGDNTIGFVPRQPTTEVIETRTFIDKITNEGREVLLSNLSSLLPPGTLSFDEQSLINFAGARLDDLLGSTIGRAILANIDLFGDSPSLGNISSSNIPEIDKTEANQITLDLGENLTESNFNNSDNISETLESVILNNSSSVIETIENNLSPLVISLETDNNSNSLNNGIPQTVIETITDTNSNFTSIIIETLEGEASLFIDNLENDLVVANVPSSDLGGTLEVANSIKDDLNIELNSVENNTEIEVDIIENCNSENNIGENIKENIENNLKERKDNLDGIVKPVTILKDNLDFRLKSAVISKEDLEFNLKDIFIKNDNLEGFIKPAIIESISFELSLNPVELINSDLNFNLTEAPIIKTDLELSLNETPKINGNLDLELNSANSKKDSLKGELTEAPLIEGFIVNSIIENSLLNKEEKLIQESIITLKGLITKLEDNAKIESKIEIITEIYNTALEAVKVKDDDLIITLNPAINPTDTYEETSLDAYEPNYINPQQDC